MGDFTDDMLRITGGNVSKKHLTLRQQRDELLKRCQEFVFLEKTNMTKKQVQLQIDRTKETIANIQ